MLRAFAAAAATTVVVFQVSVQVAELQGDAILGSCVLQQCQQQPCRSDQQQHQQQQVLLPLLCPVSVAAAVQPCKETAPSVSVRIDSDVELRANPKHFAALKLLASQFKETLKSSGSNSSTSDVLYVRPFLSAEALRLIFAVPPYTPQLPVHTKPHRLLDCTHRAYWTGGYSAAFHPQGAAAVAAAAAENARLQHQQQQQHQHVASARRQQQQHQQQHATDEPRAESCSSDDEDWMSRSSASAADAAASVSSLSESAAVRQETVSLAPASVGCLFDVRQMIKCSLPAFRHVRRTNQTDRHRDGGRQADSDGDRQEDRDRDKQTEAEKQTEADEERDKQADQADGQRQTNVKSNLLLVLLLLQCFLRAYHMCVYVPSL